MTNGASPSQPSPGNIGYICDSAINAEDWRALYRDELLSSAWSFEKIRVFSGQNMGNIIHRLATLNLFDENIVFLHHQSSPDEIESCKVLVKSVANLLQPNPFPRSRERGIDAKKPFDWLLNQSRKHNIPCLLIGVGAQSPSRQQIPAIPVELKDFFLEFTESNHVFARGPFTRDVLTHFGIKKNIHVTGCPALFLNGNRSLGLVLEKKMRETSDTLIHFTNTSRAYLSGLNDQIDRKATCNIDNGVHELCRKAVEQRGATQEHFARFNDRFYAFINPRDLHDMLKQMSGHVVSLRIHGAMMGLMAELPTLCVAHDARIEELCEMSKIPSLTLAEAAGFDWTRPFQKASFSGEAFDKNRLTLSKVHLDIFKRLGINPAKQLLLEETLSRPAPQGTGPIRPRRFPDKSLTRV